VLIALINTFKYSFTLSLSFLALFHLLGFDYSLSEYLAPFFVLNAGCFIAVFIHISDSTEKISYWENGRLKQIKIYKYKLLHGDCMEWYPNGNFQSKTRYVLGKLNGWTSLCDEEGKVRMKSYYKDDMLHGKATIWFDDSKVINYYRKGKKNGSVENFDRYGNILGSGNFLNGEIHGLFRTYRPPGNGFSKSRIENEAFFINGKMNGLYIEYIGFRHYTIQYLNDGESVCYKEIYREDKNSKEWTRLRKSLIELDIPKEQLYKFDALRDYDEVMRKKHPDITNHLWEKRKAGVKVDEEELFNDLQLGWGLG